MKIKVIINALHLTISRDESAIRIITQKEVSVKHFFSNCLFISVIGMTKS